MPKLLSIALLAVAAVAGCGRHTTAAPPTGGNAAPPDLLPPSDLLPPPPPDAGPRPEPPPPSRACGGPSQCGFEQINRNDACEWRTQSRTFDLDGDGHLDWLQICANGLFARRTLVDAAGHVTFAPIERLDVGAQANGVTYDAVVDAAGGDLDGDGQPDLVVRVGDHLTVFLRAPGGLDAGQVYAVPAAFVSNGNLGTPTALAVGDVNGDGFADVVINQPQAGAVAVYLSQAGGALAPPFTQTLAASELDIRLADIDGDQRADLVVGDWGDQQAFIAPAQANGHFLVGTPLLTGVGAQDVVSGDFNEDGHPDLVVSRADYQGNTEYFRLTVDLAPATAGGDYSATTMPAWCGTLWSGDFNGDHHLDVLTSGYEGESLLLYYGDGRGNLAVYDSTRDGYVPLPSNWGGGQAYLAPPAVADLNGDGVTDMVVNSMFGDYAIYLGSAVTPPFVVGARQPDGNADVWYQVGDLDGDHLPDLVSGYGGGDPVRLRRGAGQGAFATPQLLPMAALTAVVADFDGQPGDDIFALTAAPGPGAALWTGGLSGAAHPVANLATQGYTTVQLARLTGDAHPGLFLGTNTSSTTSGGGTSISSTLALARGRGDGTFADPLPLTLSGDLTRVETGDFDCDGHGDVALLVGTTLTVQYADGQGGFVAPLTVAADLPASDVVAGDFDGHGCSDLAVGQTSYVRLLLGRADRTFAAGPAVLRDGYAASSYPRALQAADFDGDGALDLVLMAQQEPTILLWLNHGDGTFDFWNQYLAVNNWTDSYLVADLDGNGRPDLVSIPASGPWMLLNTF